MSNAQDHVSPVHQRFETHVSQLSPWIYLSFFTITGASLKLDLLMQVWPIALIFFGVRLLGLGAGATLGGAISGNLLINTLTAGWALSLKQVSALV